ncbi:MAG TPA: FCD domain-containing protein [Leifsonia sp.]|nr:GntR family transcriptional regulator [Microbacteriaceae bacterium]HEV7813379.1 FCD domain-containing protein [Leifsonia sp.]
MHAHDSVRSRSRIGTGLYAHVVEVLGQEIIDGAMPTGTIVFADQLCERLGVSRSVVRESLRTLSSMGLVEARPQVGTTVLHESNWDLLNPHVVKWRAQGRGYVEQMRQLLELRLGLEQTAARLASERISPADAARIFAAAVAMREAFDAQDTRDFFEADALFHRILLEGTGNAVIAQLADIIGAVLHVRGSDSRPGMHDLSLESVERHIKLAQALIDGDPAQAQSSALELIEATLLEFSRIGPASP